MPRRRSVGSFLAPAFAVAALIGLINGTTSSAAEEKDLSKHQKLAQDVLDQLLTVVPQPDSDWEDWPPKITVIDVEQPNAFAGPEMVDGKRVPRITVHRGEIEKVAQFDPDALALTIGHELGHLVLHHSLKTVELIEKQGNQTVPLTVMAVKREHELDADKYGLQIALEAGFKPEGLMRNLINSHINYPPYCASEALSATHPSWEERCELMTSDEFQRSLWHSTAAFRNGVFLLEAQRYAQAEACFRRVTKAFPKCYEAWANLGYALLMQYCDALEPQDLRDLDIGHLVVGGFYRRPKSLEGLRAADDELWLDAVEALKAALDLNPDLLLVKANLAVAYLVSPEGKDVGEAEQLFSDVLAQIDTAQGKSLDPMLRVAILVNATAGRPDADPKLLERASKALGSMRGDWLKSPEGKNLSAALAMNRARSFVATPDKADDAEALKLYEQYLAATSRSCAWWTLAYDQYAALAKSLGKAPLAAEKIPAQPVAKWRPTLSLELDGGKQVSLGSKIGELEAALGKEDQVTPVIDGTALALHCYEQRGIYVLGTSEVIAVFLRGKNAPPVTLREQGLGGQPAKLSIGMTRTQVAALLGDEWGAESAVLYDPKVAYEFYPAAGVALRFDASGKVSEIAIVVVPKMASDKS